eukprot:PhF_6_TR29256/c0_g1_i1/m.42841
MYIAAALTGAGGACIWAAQGTYLSLCCTSSNAGKHAGVFACGMGIAAFCGNTAVYLFLEHAGPDELFLCFLSVCIVGIIVALFLPKVHGDGDEYVEFSLTKLMLEYRSIKECKPYLHATVWFVFTGLWMTYVFWFTSVFVGVTHGSATVGLSMIFFSICSSVSPSVMGPLIDRLGVPLSVVIALIFPMVGLLIMGEAENTKVICVIVGTILGCGDGSIQTITNAFISPIEFTPKPLLFAVYQALQAISSSILTINALQWSFGVTASIVIVLGVLSAASIMYSDREERRILQQRVELAKQMEKELETKK